MNSKTGYIGKLFLLSALVMLVIGLFLGVMAAHSYIIPQFWKDIVPFNILRPMHVSSVIFWILMGATGCVYSGLYQIGMVKPKFFLGIIQFVLWLVAITGVFYSYYCADLGGREYWEFNPVYALPIALAWLLFLINFIRVVRSISVWPVYVWMWMTGIVFFLFSFTENYLWIFSYFRDSFIQDTTIQWKANGSLVGAWNQIIYGTAFYLMERISRNKQMAFSRISFAMYFLGLFNLMFNWGHHIYTLPTDSYVRYIGYGVSMTEWIFFARILYNWKNQVDDITRYYHHFSYRFIMASEIWVFINMGQAILMSIPALNLFTHGTHVTVAHAMGTTIGINTMILLAACFEFLDIRCVDYTRSRVLNYAFWVTQGALFLFWLSLNIAGIEKGIWQVYHPSEAFGSMMDGLSIWFYVFVYSGSVMLISISTIALILIWQYATCFIRRRNQVSEGSKFLNNQVKFKTT